MDFIKIYIDVQPQETQAYAISEYGNTFTLRNMWNTKIYMKMNIRGLNLLKMLNSFEKG